MNMKAALDGLDAVKGDLSDGQARSTARRSSKMTLKTPDRRGASSTTTARRSARRSSPRWSRTRKGNCSTRSCSKVDNVNQTLGMPRGRLQDRLARRAGLPVKRAARGLDRAVERSDRACGRCRAAAPRALASSDALVLEGVTRSFGALRARRRRLARRCAAGERRAVIGANGAGKTTLFNAITGDFPPTAGRVRFFGDDVTAMPPYERIRDGPAAHLSVVAAVPRPVGARQPVPRRARRGARPLQLLRARGAATHRASRPRICSSACGSRTSPTSRSASLSHGQQRQLEIGMALAGAPRLILFDEPAAGPVAGRARASWSRCCARCRAHMGFVLIEHDLDIALRVVERVTVHAQRPPAQGRHAGRDRGRRRGAGDLHGRGKH